MHVTLVLTLTGLHLLLNFVNSSSAEEYVLPLSLNPVIQTPIELSPTLRFFYQNDPEFFSKVALTDVADDTQKDLKDLILMKLSVVMFTVASSHLAKTLENSDLKYVNGSKWSYSVSVEDLIAASEGSIVKLDDAMQLYLVQELGMKLLERRFNFNMSEIQSQLGLSRMEFLGANEEQWIKIVGIITEIMINRTSKELGFPPCYLPELLNTTKKNIEGFTLNEVDEHIYNISNLRNKVPEFKETVLAKTFNVTPAELATLSGLNISMVNTMELQNQIRLLTNDMLQKFHLSIDTIATKYKKCGDAVLTPCPEEWEIFQRMIVEEAFEDQAKNMSITNKTLSLLIQIPYGNISHLSPEQMEQLINNEIKKVKERKNIIEQKSLFILMHIDGQTDVINLSENTFSIIQTVTNFSKSELSLIYGWENSHFIFAEMFSVADLVFSCSPELFNYTLLKLAEMSAGEDTTELCKTLSALREIWEKKTINEIEERFGKQLSNLTLENMLLALTEGNLTFINRVLNSSSNARALCANVILDDISMASSLTTTHLKQKSFQYIIELAEELKTNGLLFQNVKMIMPNSSRELNSMHTSIEAQVAVTTKTDKETRIADQTMSRTSVGSAKNLLTKSIITETKITNQTMTRTPSAFSPTKNLTKGMITESRIANQTRTSSSVSSANNYLSKGMVTETRITNQTMTFASGSSANNFHSKSVIMATRIANHTTSLGLVGAKNSLLTKDITTSSISNQVGARTVSLGNNLHLKGYISTMITLLLSMYLVLV
ncbi:uncharacterized protein LOC114521903 [Dendronephthya gigantea]|uniref:uncharacterized protein LOC114521903 n=1 Tax=Dendronephthya gigantea TaxID=151771 RepID=UPI001069E776|nr:uncharacterized protein LOC114521903 [Dendronephthya gigantea]